MALFGKADADLPYLTRFYQVDVPPSFYDLDFDVGANIALAAKSEIGQFARGDAEPDVQAVIDHAEALSVKEANRERFHGPEEEQPDGYDSDLFYLGESIFGALVKFHRMVQTLMNALADGDSVTLRFVRELELAIRLTEDSSVAYVTFQSGRRFANAPDPPGFNEEKVLVAPDDIAFSIVNGQHFMGLVKIGEEIKALLPLQGAKAEKVKRCEECNSPFVILRKGQTYCSYRCGHRAGTRRRRSEKKPS